MVFRVSLNQTNFTANDVMTMVRVSTDIYFISKTIFFIHFNICGKQTNLEHKNQLRMELIKNPANEKDVLNYMAVLRYTLTYVTHMLQ